MKFLGNFSDWVKPNIVDILMNSTGQVRPGAEESQASKEQYKQWGDIEPVGAKWSFHYNEIGIDDIELPVKYTGKLNWWFVKLNPTCVFPLHRDTFHDDSANVRRLWIPYQDFIPGHVFLYKDHFIKDYTRGDIFEFDDPLALHGSANLGTVPKLSLQIVIHLNEV
jgi:hypothetical protein